MAIPNLIGLILLSGVVIKETKSYLLRETDKKNKYLSTDGVNTDA